MARVHLIEIFRHRFGRKQEKYCKLSKLFPVVELLFSFLIFYLLNLLEYYMQSQVGTFYFHSFLF